MVVSGVSLVGVLAALVTPGLLYGGAAAMAVPILIHLLNRRRYRRVRWAAMDFLMEAHRRNRRRMRVEELLLLALRCLAMFLVGVMIARWFVSPGALMATLGTGGQTERIIVLDDSFSMGLQVHGQAGEAAPVGQPTVFGRGRSAVEQLVRTLREESPNDPLTFLLTSRPDRPIRVEASLSGMDAVGWSDDLAALAVSSRGGNMTAALAGVRALLDARSTATGATVYVVSDFQRHEWPTGEAGSVAGPAAALAGWAGQDRSLQLVLIDAGVDARRNLCVTAIEPQQAQAVVGVESRFTVRAANYGRESSEPGWLQVYVGDAAQPPVAVPPIPPRESIELAVEVTFPTEGAEVLAVELPADPLPADDTRRQAVPVTRTLRILVVNGERSADPYTDEVYLLAVALRPEGPQFSGNEVVIIDDNELGPANLADFHVVMLANVYGITDEAAEHLHRYVADGGGLAIFVGDQIDAELYDRLLFREGAGLLPGRLGELVIVPAEQAGVGIVRLEAGHPLMHRLAGDGVSLFQNAAFWQYLQCEPRVVEPDASNVNAAPTDDQADRKDDADRSAQVLAELADADRSPLIVARPFGQGQVVLFTSTADKEWNNLPDQPVFVVWAQELVQFLARRASAVREALVGEPIRVPLAPGRFQPTAVLKPPTFPAEPAVEVALQPDPETGRPWIEWRQTDHPGAYRFDLTDAGGGTVPEAVAVNLDPRESDLARADRVSLLAAAGAVPTTYLTAADLEVLRDEQARRELWPMIWIALLAVLLLEQGLAWYFGAGRDLSALWRGAAA